MEQRVDGQPVTGDDSSVEGIVNAVSLADRLRVRRIPGEHYVGHPPHGFAQRVFGGQLLAQVLLSATADDGEGRLPASVHAYYHRPGDPDEPIAYQVEALRRGNTLATWSVTATQQKRVLMSAHVCSAKPTLPATGLRSVAIPQVPEPESLDPLHVRHAENAAPDGFNRPPRRDWWTGSRPMDIRYIDGPPTEPRRFWFRTEPVDGAPQSLHRAILAYASDRSLLPADDHARGRLGRAGERRVASIDHALWFHDEVRSGDWILFSQDCPHSTDALVTARGTMHSRDGRLLATVVQQGLRQPAHE
ncbi:acyl-CoA thioesterase [Nocardia otitidiscaviarum]|uniref:acyl-CoA thioesterase n=1 Tax=Nocardia otitidiscaviarum TaxID=1823 RepID=UPI0018953B8B|nr:acyl-CoA thioesterase domain-containing protein [Nocardia otitidiscaviarum]MBF6180812.1 thioesterase family protein [Nocardia otitidiscaviarum]